jgi:hypothetical protein
MINFNYLKATYMMKNNSSEISKEQEKKIEQHKKSAALSSSKVKGKNSESSDKNIKKPGENRDDWDDPTGNSHISARNK